MSSIIIVKVIFAKFLKAHNKAKRLLLVFYHGISLSFLSLQGEISARHLVEKYFVLSNHCLLMSFFQL